MQLPPPGQEPSAAWMAEFKALPFRERLDLTVQLAERLGDVVKQTFPQAAAEVEARRATSPLSELSVEEKLVLGDKVSSDLYNVAMDLAPEQTLDLAEAQLAKDTASASQASLLLQQLRTGEAPQ